jgi:hypothetical protein
MSTPPFPLAPGNPAAPLPVQLVSNGAFYAAGNLRDNYNNIIGISGNPLYTTSVEVGASWNYVAPSGGYTTTTTTVLIAADYTGNRQHLRWMTLQNVSTTATEFTILGGSAGTTVLYRVYLPASMITPLQVSFPQNAMASYANEPLNYAAATTGTKIYINAGGYTAP